MTRTLTAIERIFIQEAIDGNFLPDIDADGFPYALGAHHAGSLFSMEIKETRDRYSGGSVYGLPEGVIAEILETESAQAATGRARPRRSSR
jgi:hypothetical protein